MKSYRKSEFLIRFSEILRLRLKKKFPNVRITASFLANQYNLNNKTEDSISDETCRKWLNGKSLPSSHRMSFLMDFLEFSMNDTYIKNNMLGHPVKIVINQNAKLQGLSEVLEKLNDSGNEFTIEFK